MQALIEKNKISLVIDEKKFVLSKPGEKLDEDKFLLAEVLIEADEELQYVSRGALKLKKAMDELSISFEDCWCLDVGLSTGGFSDLMLQSGAAKVLGVDVGRDQLHSSLRMHPKLLWYDKVNAREPLSSEILEAFFESRVQKFDRIVVDVSFISLDKIIPNLLQVIDRDGIILCLVKPQFELTRKDLNSQGVVKSPERANEALEKIRGVFLENGIKILFDCPSPIEGDNGNKEFLLSARGFDPIFDKSDSMSDGAKE